ncbi:MAG: collagen-like protein [Cytophagaceae bacterium]
MNNYKYLPLLLLAVIIGFGSCKKDPLPDGPKGEQGLAGEQGETGPDGISGYLRQGFISGTISTSEDGGETFTRVNNFRYEHYSNVSESVYNNASNLGGSANTYYMLASRGRQEDPTHLFRLFLTMDKSGNTPIVDYSNLRLSHIYVNSNNEIKRIFTCSGGTTCQEAQTITDNNYDITITNYSFNATTGNLSYNYVIIVDASRNTTGQPLRIAGNVSLRVSLDPNYD